MHRILGIYIVKVVKTEASVLETVKYANDGGINHDRI